MQRYEYKVIPAPVKGRRAKGAKSPEARFALVVEEAMNAMAAEGWEYLRAETLPQEEGSMLKAGSTSYRNLLVFRREAVAARMQAEVLIPAEPESPRALAAPSVNSTEGVAPRIGSARRGSDEESAAESTTATDTTETETTGEETRPEDGGPRLQPVT